MCIALYCMCILFYYRSLLVSTQPENFTSCILESYEKNNLGNPGKQLYLGTYANTCISEPVQTTVFGKPAQTTLFGKLRQTTVFGKHGLSENFLPKIYIIAHCHYNSSNLNCPDSSFSCGKLYKQNKTMSHLSACHRGHFLPS